MVYNNPTKSDTMFLADLEERAISSSVRSFTAAVSNCFLAVS
jgi:hypothetical protein